MSAPEHALVKRAADDMALMPPPPMKKIKRPPKTLDEDDYTEALSNIIARDYFPGLRETKAQQEYLAALESNNEAWIAEAARKLRDAPNITRPPPTTRTSRDRRYNSPSATPQAARAADTPIGNDGSETPMSVKPTATASLGEATTSDKLNTSTLSLSSFQSTYTSEDNASFNDVLDKQNVKRRKKHAYLWTPDQRIPSKGLLLSRAKEQAQLASRATSKSSETAIVALTSGAVDSRPAQPTAWKNTSPANNLMFNASSVDESGFQTQAELRESNSKAGPKQTVHENTRFPPLQYVDDIPAGTIPPSPSLNTDIIIDRTSGKYTTAPELHGGETPRVNGYAFVDEDEPDTIPQPQPSGPSYRDLLAGQVGDATPNPFKLSASQKREELHHKMVEETNRKKRAKEMETRRGVGGEMAGSMVKDHGNMTPAARKLMDKLGSTPMRNSSTTRPKATDMWTPVRTPRRVKG